MPSAWGVAWGSAWGNAWGSLDTVTIAVSGTGASLVPLDIVTGGKTIILTITGDTWVADDGTFAAIRQAIIDGLDSNGSETTGWNAEVRNKLSVTTVVRTSDTVVTITLSAQAAYAVSADEVVTVTVPASALVGGAEVTASPQIRIRAKIGKTVRRRPHRLLRLRR